MLKNEPHGRRYLIVNAILLILTMVVWFILDLISINKYNDIYLGSYLVDCIFLTIFFITNWIALYNFSILPRFIFSFGTTLVLALIVILFVIFIGIPIHSAMGGGIGLP